MSEAGGGMQDQRWGVFAGIIAGLFFLNRLRKRRKIKKIARVRAQALARREKKGLKEEEARRRARAKARMKADEQAKKATRKEKKKEKKRRKKDRPVIEQLIRFAVLQFAKKAIAQQIKGMEADLGKSKLGSRIAGRAGQAQA